MLTAHISSNGRLSVCPPFPRPPHPDMSHTRPYPSSAIRGRSRSTTIVCKVWKDRFFDSRNMLSSSNLSKIPQKVLGKISLLLKDRMDVQMYKYYLWKCAIVHKYLWHTLEREISLDSLFPSRFTLLLTLLRLWSSWDGKLPGLEIVSTICQHQVNWSHI